MIEALGDDGMLEGPLLVIAHYRMPLPINIWSKRREEMHTCPHDKKPDSDNLEKYLNDCCSGVLWRDDCRIAWTLKSKSHTRDREGSTVFFITEIPSDKPDYAQLLAVISEHICIE